MKTAVIAFAVSAGCFALLGIFRFADGSPAAGAILLVVALAQIGVAFAARRLGTGPPPPL